MKPATIIRRAIEAMNDEGGHWIRGSLIRGKDKYCALGALNHVTDSTQEYFIDRKVDLTEEEIRARQVLAFAILQDHAELTSYPANSYDFSSPDEINTEKAEDIIVEFNDNLFGKRKPKSWRWNVLKETFKKAEKLAKS